MITIKRRWTVICLVAAAFGIPPALAGARSVKAQNQPQQSSYDPYAGVPRNLRARTIPKSNNTVTLTITLTQTGEMVEASQREGGLIRIEKKGQWIAGITPFIADKTTGAVKLTIFRISRVRNEAGKIVGEQMDYTETTDANTLEAKSLTTSDLPIALQVKSINLSQRPIKVATDYGTLGGDDGNDGCCVSCGDLTACACKVTMSCGSCCSGGPCC